MWKVKSVTSSRSSRRTWSHSFSRSSGTGLRLPSRGGFVATAYGRGLALFPSRSSEVRALARRESIARQVGLDGGGIRADGVMAQIAGKAKMESGQWLEQPLPILPTPFASKP